MSDDFHTGIELQSRQKPYLIQKARVDSSEDRKLALDVIKSLQPHAMHAGKNILDTPATTRNHRTAASRIDDATGMRLGSDYMAPEIAKIVWKFWLAPCFQLRRGI